MVKPINFKVTFDEIPEPIRADGAGATDPGPRDILRALENPDMLYSKNKIRYMCLVLWVITGCSLIGSNY